MIDKVFIHRHIYLDGGNGKLLTEGFNFKDHLKIEIVPFIITHPDFGQIIAVEVSITTILTNDFYKYHTRTEFIIKGSPDFSNNHDKQLLAEMCVIAYHHTGQYFAQSRAMVAWNKEKLEQISVETVLSEIASGKIPLPAAGQFV